MRFTSRKGVKPIDWGSLGPSGYDPCKKIKGRKRHILVDTAVLG
jgi:hypothetical protein